MQWYSPDEVAIFQQARGGDIPGALAALEDMEPSLSRSRYALLYGKVRIIEDAAHRNAALEEFVTALRDAHRDPETYMMLLVEASLLAFRGNKGQQMKRLHFAFLQLDVDPHLSGHPAVAYWRGSFLLNYANHLVRTRSYAQALEALDTGLPHISSEGEHWCHIPRAQYVRAWCLTELGRLSEAQAALLSLEETDRDSRHRQLYLLGLSRLLLAEKNFSSALVSAKEAEECARDRGDWEIVVEAVFQLMLVVVANRMGDGLREAQEVGALAHKHGIGYAFAMVQTALQTIRTRKEEVSV